MGPVLRRMTMNFPPLLFHPINSITAYKGQIIYDTANRGESSDTGAVSAVAARPRRRATGHSAGSHPGDLVLPPPAEQVRFLPDRPAWWAAVRRQARFPASSEAVADAHHLAKDVTRQRISDHRAEFHGDCWPLHVQQAQLAAHARYQWAAGGFVHHHRGLPDVATLPQNSPVMVDDGVTVGSLSGLDAVQRPDGTFYAAARLSLNPRSSCRPTPPPQVAQTSLLGSQHIELAAP